MKRNKLLLAISILSISILLAFASSALAGKPQGGGGAQAPEIKSVFPDLENMQMTVEGERLFADVCPQMKLGGVLLEPVQCAGVQPAEQTVIMPLPVVCDPDCVLLWEDGSHVLQLSGDNGKDEFEVALIPAPAEPPVEPPVFGDCPCFDLQLLDDLLLAYGPFDALPDNGLPNQECIGPVMENNVCSFRDGHNSNNRIEVSVQHQQVCLKNTQGVLSILRTADALASVFEDGGTACRYSAVDNTDDNPGPAGEPSLLTIITDQEYVACNDIIRFWAEKHGIACPSG